MAFISFLISLLNKLTIGCWDANLMEILLRSLHVVRADRIIGLRREGITFSGIKSCNVASLCKIDIKFCLHMSACH